MELTVQNLVKQYPKKRALDDVSFLLREGVYGLLGPNGAGKTTLINIIAGILRPTSGRSSGMGRTLTIWTGATGSCWDSSPRPRLCTNPSGQMNFSDTWLR